VSTARASLHTRRGADVLPGQSAWRRLAIALGLVLVALAPAVSAQAAGSRSAKSGAPNQQPQTRGGSAAFKATGYFTTVHEHGRWFFVTPTGQPFFSTGVDHVTSDPDTDQTTSQCPYCETIQSQYPSTSAWVTATVA